MWPPTYPRWPPSYRPALLGDRAPAAALLSAMSVQMQCEVLSLMIQSCVVAFTCGATRALAGAAYKRKPLLLGGGCLNHGLRAHV